MTLFARVVRAYSQVPPHLLGEVRWQMSELTAETIARQAGRPDFDGATLRTADGLRLFDIPVDITEGDGVLLAWPI